MTQQKEKGRWLISNQDKSINVVMQPSQAEARFVQRQDDYAIIYLSIQNGCDKACRFCHLTQQKQTDATEQTVQELQLQMREVLSAWRERIENQPEEAKKLGSLTKIHINFMARGDIGASEQFRNNPKVLIDGLMNTLKEARWLRDQSAIKTVQMNLSTIGLPGWVESEAILNLPNHSVDQESGWDITYGVYYSLYSLNKSFRKRWLPKAIEPETMRQWLLQWQESGGLVIFHWAMIEGENDQKEDWPVMEQFLKVFETKAKFNLVRYNPFGEGQGAESDEVTRQWWLSKMKALLKNPDTREIKRVGFDVKASCGMFVAPEKQ